MKRDFVGYGQHLPVIRWPNNAILAIQLVVNYEEGAEHSIEEGDEYPEAVGEIPGVNMKICDLTNESVYEYGTRVAIWRILNLLSRHDVKATFFACAVTLKLCPESAKEIVHRGHEICSHGYRWHEHFKMAREEERESIRKAVASIAELTGERPVGWYCREPGINTRELIVEEEGFLYDSDAYNDDLPYYVKVRDKSHLVIPYTLDANDFHFYMNRFVTTVDFFQYLKDTFDILYEESKTNPKMMTVGLHVRITGRPGRIAALDRFIRYAKGFPYVWFARRIDIAKWWLQHNPPRTQPI